MKKKTILKGISILSAAVLVAAVGNIVRIGHSYSVGENTYSDLANVLTSNRAAEMYVKDTSDSAAPIDVDFAMLKAMNASAVGWLYCPGTEINYPVMQSPDNDYYLTHLFDNQTNSSGAIFMDSLNSADMTDANTVIYGHNMKNGSMFCSLQYYSDQSYYEQHPVMYYLTDSKNYRIDIFASYETSNTSEATTINFNSAEDFDGYLQRVWSKSDIDTSWLDMSADDNIITLSTCAYDYHGARYVVQGKITPMD